MRKVPFPRSILSGVRVTPSRTGRQAASFVTVSCIAMRASTITTRESMRPLAAARNGSERPPRQAAVGDHALQRLWILVVAVVGGLHAEPLGDQSQGLRGEEISDVARDHAVCLLQAGDAEQDLAAVAFDHPDRHLLALDPVALPGDTSRSADVDLDPDRAVFADL